MRKLHGVLGLLAAGVMWVGQVGCYSGSSRFRTANGEPAPTYSRMDSMWKPVPVSCGHDTFYLVDAANQSENGKRIRHDAPPEVQGLTTDMFCGLVRGVDARIAAD